MARVRSDRELLRLAGVGFGYPGLPIFSGLDLTLRQGRCYGVLGPNGGGKTTLLDLCCGLLAPGQGEVLLAGRPLGRIGRRDLARRVALVPQDFAVRFEFGVREVVAMGRHPHLARFADPVERDEHLIDAVMAELDVDRLAARPVTALSGGEKQRVAVARALVQEPELLLLDEAFSNLDVFHAQAILGVIRERIEHDGLTVVAALHDLNLAAAFCDELIFLDQGRIVAQGPVDEVFRDEIIERVYGVEARVGRDGFGEGRRVSFRLRRKRSEC